MQFSKTKNAEDILICKQFKIYLGVSKSSGAITKFPDRKVEKIFFFYEKIERLSLYFSMLFDHYSTDIIIIKFR